MIRDDVKIIITPTGVLLKEVLTKEVVKALNEEAARQYAMEAFVSEYWQACYKEGFVD